MQAFHSKFGASFVITFFFTCVFVTFFSHVYPTSSSYFIFRKVNRNKQTKKTQAKICFVFVAPRFCVEATSSDEEKEGEREWGSCWGGTNIFLVRELWRSQLCFRTTSKKKKKEKERSREGMKPGCHNLSESTPRKPPSTSALHSGGMLEFLEEPRCFSNGILLEGQAAALWYAGVNAALIGDVPSFLRDDKKKREK